MQNYQQQKQFEEANLQRTLNFIGGELEDLVKDVASYRRELIAFKQDMTENTAPFSSDFDKLTEMVQYLSEIKNQTASYTNISEYAQRYQKLIQSPYFGRFDFKEEGFAGEDKIYIGLANVMDKNTHEVYVYDWRAPIASIFYRYEPGPAEYETPLGPSKGRVLLKRQYKIINSKLRYFFDCSVRITDDILQEVLSRHASVKMRNIVETIQKEQDIVIRDTENQLLIVQGAAGSGKTSIALHRIAFLLYEGLNTNLKSQNILIISPHDVFSQYISGVLPELGEENVLQATFDDLYRSFLSPRFTLSSKEDYLEELILTAGSPEGERNRQRALFKGSDAFRRILDKWLAYYGRKLIAFEDASFNGKILAGKQLLKNRFLHNEIDVPMNKQLAKLERYLLPLIHPYKKEHLQKIAKIVAKSERHALEVKSFSRLLMIRQCRAYRRRIRNFTKVDFYQIYRLLFSHPHFMAALARDPSLPPELMDYFRSTSQYLNRGQINYEDYAPLLYLQLKIEGRRKFSAIKQVIIDEAQDYTPLQYHIFKLLFRGANFTLLGDINQSIIGAPDMHFYDQITAILAAKKSSQLLLRKSFRSTMEIQTFTRQLLNGTPQNEIFPRKGEPVSLWQVDSATALRQVVLEEMARLLEAGCETAAVICKSQKEAETVYGELKNAAGDKLSGKLTLVKPHDKDYKKGPMVISVLMAKGLEFDGVIVYNAGKDNYRSESERNLLYIACTRALHHLSVTCLGEKSPFIREPHPRRNKRRPPVLP